MAKVHRQEVRRPRADRTQSPQARSRRASRRQDHAAADAETQSRAKTDSRKNTQREISRGRSARLRQRRATARHGQGRPRRGDSLPEPRLVRARRRRARSGIGRGDRKGVQRLAARFLQSRPAAHVRRRYHRAARCLSGGRRDSPVVKELGFRSVLVRPNHVNGRMWSDPYYNPLWEECQKLGIPVGFHEAGRVYLPQPALHEFIPSFTMFNTLSFPMANMFACADIIYGGVLERFPKLKVAYLEGNCSWIPWLLWRMGEYAELTGSAEHPEMKLEPLEYFQRQCWGSIECDEVVAKNLPDFGLEDNIVFSTDYPHLDVKYPRAVETFLALPFSEQTKRKYLWDNCARLYGFDN